MLMQYEYFGLIMLIYGVVIFVCCCLNILVGVWVYRDAEKRQMDNPAVWLAIVLLGGCIGCIIYLIVRDPIPMGTTGYSPGPGPAPLGNTMNQTNAVNFCPKCGSKLHAGATFCSECGAQL